MRCHYLPQFYLKYFLSRDNKLWVYDRNLNEYREQTPKATGVKKGYYKYKGKDGKMHNDIEELFKK